VIHYSEGAVLIDGTRFDHKPATFPLLKEGCTLETQKGRVEMMLTPGVFLRMDENSSVKMMSAALEATQVEFLRGSVIVDALAAQGDIPDTVHFRDAAVHFDKPGLYRIDSETEVLQAYSGEATVQQQAKRTNLGPNRLYFFQLGTDTKKFTEGTDDEFYDWARMRSDIVNEQNQTADADDDDADAFPYVGGAATPFNYSVPTIPQIGPTYPSAGQFYTYNSFASSPFWTLPPIPSPLIVVPRWTYHRPATSHWPTTGVWASHRSSVPGINANTWLATHPPGTYIRPATPTPHIGGSMPHPGYVRPFATPRISAPAAHVGHR
jgi:hypothetical protein